MSLSKMFKSMKSRTSSLIKSGFIARTANIFRGFLLDCARQVHTNGLLTTQLRP